MESIRHSNNTNQNGALTVQEPPAPNCIKYFLDLPGDTGQPGLTLQLFPMLILVNQV